MRELIFRILRRSIPVAIVLAIMGYLFGELFLMIERMHNPKPDPANQAVRWRAPLNMVGIGVGALVVFECVAFAVRRKKPIHPLDPDTEPQNTGPAK
jgi:hypothetical protein